MACTQILADLKPQAQKRELRQGMSASIAILTLFWREVPSFVGLNLFYKMQQFPAEKF